MSVTQQPSQIPSVVVSAVNENSPLLGENATRTETLVEVNPEPVVESRESTSTLEPSTVIEVTRDSTENSSPAVNGVRTSACIDDSGSEGRQSSHNSIPTNRCTAVLLYMLIFWYKSTESMSKSWWMLPIQLCIMVLPASAAYMGERYVDECPASLLIPVLVFLMGMIGILVTVYRIAILCGKKFVPPFECRHARSVVNYGTYILVGLFLTEVLLYSKMSTPSFVSGKNDFCHEFFYKYILYANWAFVSILPNVVTFNLPSYLIGCIGPVQNLQA